MADFVIHIQLNDGSGKSHHGLYLRMKNLGFSRTIASGFGARFELPPSLYSYVGDLPPEEVCEMVRMAVDDVGGGSVIVMQGSTVWSGLPRVIR